MATNNPSRRDDTRDTNPDAITGAPGSHPVGTGVGAAGGGAAGAAIGSVVGPVGTAIGAVVGAVAGGLAGKGVAEVIDPTAEDAYWRESYRNRPYVDPNVTYDDYGPAYKYGWESSTRYQGRKFDEVERDLSSDWDRARGKSSLTWDRAKNAARDAFERIESRRTHTSSSNLDRDDT